MSCGGKNIYTLSSAKHKFHNVTDDFSGNLRNTFIDKSVYCQDSSSSFQGHI